MSGSVICDVRRHAPIFTTEPVRLLYVAAIAIAGGLVALGFDRLSPLAKRQVRIFAWGAAASTLSAFVVWFGFTFASLASFFMQAGGVVWVLLAMLLYTGIAAYLWFEFFRALKSGF